MVLAFPRKPKFVDGDSIFHVNINTTSNTQEMHACTWSWSPTWMSRGYNKHGRLAKLGGQQDESQFRFPYPSPVAHWMASFTDLNTGTSRCFISFFVTLTDLHHVSRNSQVASNPAFKSHKIVNDEVQVEVECLQPRYVNMQIWSFQSYNEVIHSLKVKCGQLFWWGWAIASTRMVVNFIEL